MHSYAGYMVYLLSGKVLDELFVHDRHVCFRTTSFKTKVQKKHVSDLVFHTFYIKKDSSYLSAVFLLNDYKSIIKMCLQNRNFHHLC